MNKSALKKFAIDARNELREKVQLKALKYGVTEEKISTADVQGSDAIFIEGRQLTNREKKQRDRLIEQINSKDFNQVIEEVAYTWFNRFTALRYMEVHDYLPTRVRVLSSSDEGSYEPDIIKEALEIDLEIDREYVYELKMSNDNDATDRLFEHLIIRQCNALNDVLPGMFENINDYTMLLFPENLLNANSFVRVMTDTTKIPEDDWNDIEIIGWLYQYYNDERRDQVINIYKGTIKKNDIPAATQLFTTDWVVRYMVDNSLGRYWIERNPNSKLKDHMEFFIDKGISYVDESISPEDLTIFDPCMGSGHILVYAFDLLMLIYEEAGYMKRDAARLILEKNIYGLDIDNRASQLAYFAVMMKAREYSRRILDKKIIPNVFALEESNGFNTFEKGSGQINLLETEKNDANYLLDIFRDAKELGSLIQVEKKEYDRLHDYIKNLGSSENIDIETYAWLTNVSEIMPKLIRQASVMSNSYCAVVTNPPYLNKMDGKLKDFMKDVYKDYSTDLFSAFMYRNFKFLKNDGYSGFMTPFVWMFIKSYEKLREYIIKNKNISSLIQMEYSAFEEATVPICSFVLKNCKTNDNGSYIKLSEFKGGMDVQKEKVLEALNEENNSYYYETNEKNFEMITGSPIAYWVSPEVFNCFAKSVRLGDIAAPRQGLSTTKNDLFIRCWYEIEFSKIEFNAEDSSKAIESQKKWFPYNKGGEFRKWYGNKISVVNWLNNGQDIKYYIRNKNPNVARGETNYFKKCLSWNLIGESNFGVRSYDVGMIFDVAAHSLFCEDKEYKYFAGLLNTKIIKKMTKILNPTLNMSSGVIANLPVIISDKYRRDIEDLVDNCIINAKNDWDSFEVSWDFRKHLLIEKSMSDHRIEHVIKKQFNILSERIEKQREYEEKLNKIFMEIYEFNKNNVEEKEETIITLKRADLLYEIQSFISYSVGCMFGRYSLDNEGLIFAGGDWEPSKYSSFIPDSDNCIPITEDKYFEDDIVGHFVEFVEKVYSRETLEENLDFIANALGNKGSTSREVIRNYFLKDFYKDHIKTYKKRPIYWLFDSGKNNGMKCLIYMHRYDESTLSRIRTDYLHVIQTRMAAQKQSLLDIINSEESVREKKKAEKELKSMDKKIQELKDYDEVLHHMADKQIKIDLDDGVKHNYNLFDGLLAKVPGLTKK